MTRCRYCGRILKSESSRILGYGPVCKSRHAIIYWRRVDDSLQSRFDFAKGLALKIDNKTGGNHEAKRFYVGVDRGPNTDIDMDTLPLFDNADLT